jgi:hypothetical protein
MPDSLFRNLALASVAAILLAGVAIAQTSLDAPLDEHSAKRLDRLEAAVREIRAIVFQGRETGQPVVVQPAETESQIASLTDRLNDLDHSLTRLNGENEVFRHDLDGSSSICTPPTMRSGRRCRRSSRRSWRWPRPRRRHRRPRRRRAPHRRRRRPRPSPMLEP